MSDCPICYTTYGDQPDGSFLTKDGKNNSEMADECKHYVCYRCCYQLSKQKIVSCPLCREDWTEWIHTHYEEDEEEEEEEEDEEIIDENSCERCGKGIDFENESGLCRCICSCGMYPKSSCPYGCGE
jgi:hypothetical protein